MQGLRNAQKECLCCILALNEDVSHAKIIHFLPTTAICQAANLCMKGTFGVTEGIAQNRESKKKGICDALC